MPDPTEPSSDLSVIDVHAHMFPPGLRELAEHTGDARWPVLEIDGDDAKVMVAGVAARKAGRTLWDLDARIDALDAAGLDMQVISPVPVTLVPWAPTRFATGWCAALNDALAAAAAQSGGRLVALGAIPLGPDHDAVPAAVAELHRIRGRGLLGVELPTLAGGRELDDPALDPVWAAAAELDLPILLHPTDPTVIRRGGQPYEFGVGMLTDTAIAATALVFGGVLERHPTMRVALSHGCGALPWTYPRTRKMAVMSMGFDAGACDALLTRLWTDTLVFDPVHLGLVAHRIGAGHLMLGTDDPMVPGQLTAAAAEVDEAVRIGALDNAAASGVLGGNALRFLGLADVGDTSRLGVQGPEQRIVAGSTRRAR